MITQDDIFGITDDAAFEAAALEVFRRQAAECPPYREYLALAGVRPEEVRAAREIPFLPIEIFKTHDVYCGGTEPEAVFTSSATTGMTPSRHPMRSLALYERTFRAAFRTFYGEPGQWSLYALLPNYLRRKGSSLVYMADRLIADCGSGGFYLDDYDALLTAMLDDLKARYPREQVESILMHEVVHWLRLMPYKLAKDRKRAPMFYAGLVMVANDVADFSEHKKETLC